ncbi:MAG: hypothetical protein E8D41_08720 [Nitrospira sp.]|nr:MAG: hypothetical protein E8D41_08720 [Nitrospira sp.]
MVRTRVVVALIVVLLIGGGGVLTFLSYLTDDEYIKDFFLQQLEQSIGRKIDVHRIIGCPPWYGCGGDGPSPD